MQTLIDLLVVTIAANGLVDAWRNGSLFASLRATIQVQQESDDPEALRQWLWELLLCSFCHSYHVAVWLFVIITIGDVVPWADLLLALSQNFYFGQLIAWTSAIPFGLFIRAVVTGVAAARLSLILNGLLPPRLRYERNPFTDNIDGRLDPAPTPAEPVDPPDNGPAETRANPAEPADAGCAILRDGGELGDAATAADPGTRGPGNHS